MAHYFTPDLKELIDYIRTRISNSSFREIDFLALDEEIIRDSEIFFFKLCNPTKVVLKNKK